MNQQLIASDAEVNAAIKLKAHCQVRQFRHYDPRPGPKSLSYYLNYNGLDRYNRQGVSFTFDRTNKQSHYDGAAWREIVQRYPKSPESAEAGKKLQALQALQKVAQ